MTICGSETIGYTADNNGAITGRLRLHDMGPDLPSFRADMEYAGYSEVWTRSYSAARSYDRDSFTIDGDDAWLSDAWDRFSDPGGYGCQIATAETAAIFTRWLRVFHPGCVAETATLRGYSQGDWADVVAVVDSDSLPGRYDFQRKTAAYDIVRDHLRAANAVFCQDWGTLVYETVQGVSVDTLEDDGETVTYTLTYESDDSCTVLNMSNPNPGENCLDAEREFFLDAASAAFGEDFIEQV